MKIRHVHEKEKIELQMTPMIDIVFQLLIFFIMTFKIVELEGDFNIRMPAAAPNTGVPDTDVLPPMTLRLTSATGGELSGIRLNDRQFSSFDELHVYIRGLVGDDAGPDAGLEGAEVELNCDYNLTYDNVVAAITAVTGHKTEDGTIVKLIEKIKFSPPKKFESRETCLAHVCHLSQDWEKSPGHPLAGRGGRGLMASDSESPFRFGPLIRPSASFSPTG